MMNNTESVLKKVQENIQSKIETGGIAYDNNEVIELLAVLGKPDLERLKNEIRLEFTSGKFITDRYHSIYIQSLIWFVTKLDIEFVLKLAKDALDSKIVLDKQPWVEILKEFNELECIAHFFVGNQNYGDKYFKENMLYVLSDTNVRLGNKVLNYLNSSDEILSSAALVVISSQKLTSYTDNLLAFFEANSDSDLILETAEIIIDWYNNPIPLIQNKIKHLIQQNQDYYEDVVLELQEMIDDIHI